MAVDITITAKDRVSSALDGVARKIDRVNQALKSTESQSRSLQNNVKKPFVDMGKSLTLLGNGMQRVGHGLTNYITKPVLAAGTALAGLTLAKGFQRMQAVDTAKAKLRAMGIEGQKLENTLDSAKAAVKGTAFGFDEAATVAASATAAGVKEGKQMDTYLGTVADVAAVAGTSYDEMGMVFNKVMANGKVSAEEWNMMTDRGVDIMGALQKSTGKSRDELLQMRKAGQITSEDFVNAMSKMYEGAAVEIGESTIGGVITNINAAIARIGESFLGATDNSSTFAGHLHDLLMSVKNALNSVEDKAGDLGKALGEWAGPAMDKMTDFFNAIASGDKEVDTTRLKLAGIAGIVSTLLGPALMIAGKAIAAFGSGGAISALTSAFPGLAGSIGAIAGPIAAVAALIAAVWINSANFRKSIMNLFSTLGQSIMKVVTALAPVVQALFELFGPLFTWLGDLLAPLVDVLSAVISAAADQVASFAEAITPSLQMTGAAAQATADKIAAMGGAWNAIKSGVKKLWAKVSEKAAGILQAIKDAWDKIVSAVKSLRVNVLGGAEAALGGIKSMWDSLVNGATKTLNVITKKSTTGGGGGGGSSWGGGGQGGSGHPKSATGTRSAGGGTTLVGERGPELVNLPKGASVHTARDTEKMLGGNNITVNLNGVTIAQSGMTIEQIAEGLANILEEKMSSSAEGAI